MQQVSSAKKINLAFRRTKGSLKAQQSLEQLGMFPQDVEILKKYYRKNPHGDATSEIQTES